MSRETKSDLIALRVTKEMKELIYKKAESNSMSVSKYILGVLYLEYGKEYEIFREFKKLEKSGKLEELEGVL